MILIKYEDIKDIGIGKAMTPTKAKEKLYFSSRILTKEEKENLDLVQNEIIYFTKLDSDWKRYIENHLNQKIYY